MGKLHLAAERGNIEECKRLMSETVRSMKDPLGHKRCVDVHACVASGRAR